MCKTISEFCPQRGRLSPRLNSGSMSPTSLSQGEESVAYHMMERKHFTDVAPTRGKNSSNRGQLEIRSNSINKNKANAIVNSERPNAFLLRLGGSVCPLLPFLVKMVL